MHEAVLGQAVRGGWTPGRVGRVVLALKSEILRGACAAGYGFEA